MILVGPVQPQRSYKKGGGSESEKKDVRSEAEVKEEKRCYIAGLVDGGRGHEPRNVGSP